MPRLHRLALDRRRIEARGRGCQAPAHRRIAPTSGRRQQMVQLDPSLRLASAPPVMHCQRTLETPDQVVSALGRDQDADRPPADGARVGKPFAQSRLCRRFMSRTYSALPTPRSDGRVMVVPRHSPDRRAAHLQLAASLAQHLANEHAGVSDNDHSGSARRRSSKPASSSSLMPVSFSTRSTVSPRRLTARRT
jgi:hypothetical protein